MLEQHHIPVDVPDSIPVNPDFLGKIFQPTTTIQPDAKSIIATDLLAVTIDETTNLNGFTVFPDVVYSTHKWLSTGNTPEYAVRLLRCAVTDGSVKELAEETPVDGSTALQLRDSFQLVEPADDVRQEALDEHARRGDNCSPIDAVIARHLQAVDDRYVATWSASDHRQYYKEVVALPTVDVDSMAAGEAVGEADHPLYVRRG